MVSPFWKIGVPSMLALIGATHLLAEFRKPRYKAASNSATEHRSTPKRSLKSLEEELEEWERKKTEREARLLREYEMKPVKNNQRDQA